MKDIEDKILQEIKEKNFFPIHNGHEQNVFPALRKLTAWGIIEPNLSNSKYTFTKEGDLLIKSGKSFYQFTHPSKLDKVRSHFNDNWVGYVIGGIFGAIVALITGYIILKIEYGYFQ